MAKELSKTNIIIIVAIIISILVLGPYVNVHIANTSPSQIKNQTQVVKNE